MELPPRILVRGSVALRHPFGMTRVKEMRVE